MQSLLVVNYNQMFFFSFCCFMAKIDRRALLFTFFRYGGEMVLNKEGKQLWRFFPRKEVGLPTNTSKMFTYRRFNPQSTYKWYQIVFESSPNL